MTTPDNRGAPEDLGLIEVFGLPLSTFTRTIKLALHELSVSYIPIPRPPHSQHILSLNPFGLLPVFVHRPDGLYTRPEDVVTLYESNGIRRYIDEYLCPLARSSKELTPVLPQAGNGDGGLAAEKVIKRAKLDSLVSVISQTLFPALEGGFIKSALQMKKNGADTETINVALEPELRRVQTLLEIVENQAKGKGKGTVGEGWLLGSGEVTWADLFLFPILDDLRASPAEGLVNGDSPTFPWLAAWLKRMDARASVKATHEGTVAHQAQT